MYGQLAETVTQLADITDPTNDGILIKVVNYGLAALMVIAALIGGWQAFQVWTAGKGADKMKELRTVVFGLLVVEAILGGVVILANYGSGLIPGFA